MAVNSIDSGKRGLHDIKARFSLIQRANDGVGVIQSDLGSITV